MRPLLPVPRGRPSHAAGDRTPLAVERLPRLRCRSRHEHHRKLRNQNRPGQVDVLLGGGWSDQYQHSKSIPILLFVRGQRCSSAAVNDCSGALPVLV